MDKGRIRHVVITWRKQKNNMNGQRVSFGDDTVSPAYSATRAACRIYKRSQRLGMKPNKPMGVFCNNKGKVQFIKDTLVNDLL